MSENFDLDKDLEVSGIVVAGHIGDKLVSDVQQELEKKQDTIQPRDRQIQLHWNAKCDAVMFYFDIVIKPSIAILEDRPCLNRWFVQYHDRPKGTSIYKPRVEKGTYNVLIVIEPGAGFPRFYEGSHVDSENEAMAPAVSTYAVEIPHRKGAVVVFDATLGRRDSAVEGIGASCIMLVY